MGNASNAQNLNVVAMIASALALAADQTRTFLQIQNRSNVVVTYKLDENFTPGRNAQQSIAFSRLPDAGAWKLTFGAAETASLAFGISAAALQAALELLASIGVGGVSVTGTVANGFLVEFIGDHAEELEELMTVTANSLTDSTVQQSAVQLVAFDLPPQAGTFRLSFGANETADLAWNISVADLKTALNALPSINGGVASVGQDVGSKSFTVTFGAPLNDQPLALIVVSDNQLTNSDGNENAQRIFTFTPAPLQGTYKLMLGDETTAEIAFDASAEEVEDALELLPSVGVGNVSVGAVFNGFVAEFINAKANMEFPALYITQSTLHADTNTEEPQKRVPEDVQLGAIIDVLGKGTSDVVATVSTIEAGIAPATMDITPAIVVAGNEEPSEGIDLQPLGEAGDTQFYDSSVPAGGIWIKAVADNSPVNILVG